MHTRELKVDLMLN